MKIRNVIIIFSLINWPILSQSFFPLEIGNQWHYELSRWESEAKDTFSISVIGDTLMDNGLEYFQLNEPLDPGKILSTFVRVDGNYIYFYDESDSLDTHVYNFHAPPTVYYNIGFNASESDSPRVQLSYIDTTEVFDEISINISFYLDWLIPFDLKFSEEYGPLGWYSAHHEPIWTKLIGCKISGINYGLIVGLKNYDQKLNKYKLMQNYPNPFNPMTTIEYQILEQSKIEIKVFDILGEVVAILVNDVKSAGIYSTVLNGNNLASGIYYYQMRANNFVETKKVLLLK